MNFKFWTYQLEIKLSHLSWLFPFDIRRDTDWNRERRLIHTPDRICPGSHSRNCTFDQVREFGPKSSGVFKWDAWSWITLSPGSDRLRLAQWLDALYVVLNSTNLRKDSRIVNSAKWSIIAIHQRVREQLLNWKKTSGYWDNPIVTTRWSHGII